MHEWQTDKQTVMYNISFSSSSATEAEAAATAAVAYDNCSIDLD